VGAQGSGMGLPARDRGIGGMYGEQGRNSGDSKKFNKIWLTASGSQDRGEAREGRVIHLLPLAPGRSPFERPAAQLVPPSCEPQRF
jgi:hypothetical protein